ncbi:MAG: hypothetical protein FJ255_10285 [Phycisphaerae bacterium]|nr:hypothetical protein [Phycisphaerae bacterium]
MNRRGLVLGAALVGLGALAGAGGLGGQPEAGKPAALPLDRLAFLEGTWAGPMGDAWVEETWSRPRGDSIIGMFRWQRGDGTTTLWELLAIRDEDRGPALRLRHHGADFAPWKSEADGVPTLRATAIEPSRVLFTNEGPTGGIASCEYHSPTPDRLLITVTFPEGGQPPLKFDLARRPAR